MLVVVALITILLGILINTASESRGPVELTKVTLKALKAAATEYEVSTNRWINHKDVETQESSAKIAWGTAKMQNVIIPPTAPTNVIIANDSSYKGGTGERFVWAALQVESSAKIIRSIEKDGLKDNNNNKMYDVLDGWGNPIRYAAYVIKGDDVWDDDLPRVGTATNSQPFFSSAGADGKWGAFSDTNVPNADATDNLHSFNLGE